jgi:uncharacterized membrane protein YfcA
MKQKKIVGLGISPDSVLCLVVSSSFPYTTEHNVSLQFIIGLILSAAIGFSLGLIGGGGSIITVPVLVYVLGVEAHDAISMSLAVVGATSLVGASLHYRNGCVELKTGLIFGGAGMVGAVVGARFTRLLSSNALMLAFAALMLVVATLMLTRKDQSDEVSQTPEGPPSLPKAIGVGMVVGVLTGFLGVGGGFLIVPALVLFAGLDMKDAVGTSLVVIAINCAAGLLGHLSQAHFDLKLTGLVALLAVTGTLGGTALSTRVRASSLRNGFAVFVMAVALFLVFKNYHVLIG